MAISRSDLLKELLPGLNALFGLEYDKLDGDMDASKHEIRVDFDGDTRRNTQTIHTTSSGSNG
jgi:hypothetical protein